MNREWGLTGSDLSHDEALKLSIDRIDWGIDARSARMVDDHLMACSDCKELAEEIANDSGLLRRFRWQDDDQSAGLEPEEWELDPDQDIDDWGQDEGGIFESGKSGSRGGQSSPSPDAGFSLDDDERDDAPAGSGTGGGDFRGPESRGSQDAEPEDDAGAPTGGPADQVLADSEEPAKPEPYEPTEDDIRAIEELAREIIKQLSDEDLGGVESQPTPDDKVVSPEITDGVDKTAAENGVNVSDQSRRQSERVIRAQDTIHDTKHGKVAVAKSTRGVATRTSNPTPKYSGPAAAAIRNAVLQSRGGHTSVERHQPRGKLDNKGVWRISMGDPRLFRRAAAPSPTPLRVWVMVDVSGSMSGNEVADAASVARALADASVGTPSVHLTVWGWSDPFIPDQRRYGGAYAGVCKVWETGMPTSEVDKLVRLPMGGTPDAAVLSWAWPEILRQKRPEEHPVIIMASDGFGYGDLKGVIAEATRKGVAVRSVALGQWIREDDQEEKYGRGNFIPWQGDIVSTARPLAKMLTKMIQGGAR